MAHPSHLLKKPPEIHPEGTAELSGPSPQLLKELKIVDKMIETALSKILDMKIEKGASKKEKKDLTEAKKWALTSLKLFKELNKTEKEALKKNLTEAKKKVLKSRIDDLINNLDAVGDKLFANS